MRRGIVTTEPGFRPREQQAIGAAPWFRSPVDERRRGRCIGHRASARSFGASRETGEFASAFSTRHADPNQPGPLPDGCRYPPPRFLMNCWCDRHTHQGDLTARRTAGCACGKPRRPGRREPAVPSSSTFPGAAITCRGVRAVPNALPPHAGEAQQQRDARAREVSRETPKRRRPGSAPPRRPQQAGARLAGKFQARGVTTLPSWTRQVNPKGRQASRTRFWRTTTFS
jgi:hypothetical protein